MRDGWDGLILLLAFGVIVVCLMQFKACDMSDDDKFFIIQQQNWLLYD